MSENNGNGKANGDAQSVEAELITEPDAAGMTPLKQSRMERRALEKGWGLTDEQRKEMLDRQVKTATDDKANDRDSRLAAEFCLKADNSEARVQEAADKQELARKAHDGGGGGLNLPMATLLAMGVDELKRIVAQAEEQQRISAGGIE